MTFELTSVDDEKTNFKLIHEGIETFTNPNFKREKFIDGWEYLIQTSLKEYLVNGKALRNW